MKEKEHLFFKNLSDFSTEQLKKVCEDVDKSFIIIRRAFLQYKYSAENEKEIVCAVYL
jgi:hypothetical protein